MNAGAQNKVREAEPHEPGIITLSFSWARTRRPTASSRRRACASTTLGREILVVEAEALRALSEQAMIDINHLLRPGHLRQLAKILDDPEATANDKFVAYDLLKNANIAAGGVLPMCQDTGTAIVDGQEGPARLDGRRRRSAHRGGDPRRLREEEPALQPGRSALDVRGEEHGDNLPAQIEISAEGEDAYKFLFIAKGGGSANKSFLYQATPSILTHDRLIAFLKEKILTLGTAACPPYHLAIVIGGTSAELTLKTVKLASTKFSTRCPPREARTGMRCAIWRSSRKYISSRSSSASARNSAANISATTYA